MPATYDRIANVTGTGSSDTISFTSIPATYTDLVLVLNGALSTGNNTRMRFNNNTGNNYNEIVLSGDGSSAVSYSTFSQTAFVFPGYTEGTISNMITQIPNYANTTTFKTFIHRRNSLGASQASFNVGTWIQTAAINRIDIFSASGATWTSSTTATIYGIKAA
jgi:hypothetical protein